MVYLPGTSPPSTTAGSIGDTVFNETAFDISERRETVNPMGPETRQTRARIVDMTCDELVNLLENKGADGSFLENVLSNGMTGAEFKLMMKSAGTAQEAVQHYQSITDMEPVKILALWCRTRAETTSGQAADEKPRLSHIGPRATDLDGHAVEREENMLESRSMDSEEFRSRTRARMHSRPSLGEEPRPTLTMQETRMFPRSHADEREEDEPDGRSEYSDEYIIKCFGAHRGPISPPFGFTSVLPVSTNVTAGILLQSEPAPSDLPSSECMHPLVLAAAVALAELLCLSPRDSLCTECTDNTDSPVVLETANV